MERRLDRIETMRKRTTEAGYSLAALMAMLAIMGLFLMMAAPSWKYLTRDDKEQELIFRGRQISAAVARFQRKNGNSLPNSLEQLVQGKYLRKAYKDPLVDDGRWRFLRPGEGVAAPRPGGPPGRPGPSPSPTATPVFGGNSGPQSGPIAGVASRSTESGIRLVNGTQAYNQWLFAPNIPFMIGGQTLGGPARPQGQGGAAPQLPPQAKPRAPDAGAPRLSR
jgi:type II secretory pathway pseudopilin PulG